MKVMAEKIEEMSLDSAHVRFNAREHLIPCIGHVLNLAVQDLLKVAFKSDTLEQSEPVSYNTDDVEYDVLSRLRRGIVIIRSSPQRRQQFRHILAAESLPSLELILDVPTRWNSTADMIQRALQLQKAYDKMSDLENAKLTHKDWHFLAAISPLFARFKMFTEALSGTKYATMSRVLLTLEVLLKTLEQLKEIPGSYQYMFVNRYVLRINI
jgi:hypothetical protein